MRGERRWGRNDVHPPHVAVADGGLIAPGALGTMADQNTVRLQAYLQCIRNTLDACLCLTNFASQEVERHNKPEVEASEPGSEILLNPILLCRNKNEMILIETSVNSVRISICVKKSDVLEQIIARKFMRFMCMRAENFQVLRREPLEGFDISLLITNFKLESLYKHKVCFLWSNPVVL